MSKELSDAEIKAILEKIRSEYREQGKLNPKSFDLAGFEKRYLQVLQYRTSVTKFLNEEIVFLEQLKSKMKSIVQKKELQKAETLNRILDENMERLSSYPKIDFHALAKPEIRYFYGALNEFCERDFPALLSIFKGTPDYAFVQEPLLQIERVGMSRRGLPSIRIQDYIKLMMDSNGSVVQMEKHTQSLLKESSFALKNLSDNITKIITQNKMNLDRTVSLDQKSESRSYDQYNGKSIGECLDIINFRAKKIIQDFRMGSLVGLQEDQ